MNVKLSSVFGKRALKEMLALSPLPRAQPQVPESLYGIAVHCGVDKKNILFTTSIELQPQNVKIWVTELEQFTVKIILNMN